MIKNLLVITTLSCLAATSAYCEDESSGPARKQQVVAADPDSSTTALPLQKSKKKQKKGKAKPEETGTWGPTREEMKDDPSFKPHKSVYKYKGEELEVDPD